MTVAWVLGAVSAVVATLGALQLAAERLQLDIAVYLMGAGHLVDGRLYLVALPHPPHLPFTYPPFAALVFFPLHLLPERAAQIVWSLVNVVALFALVWLSVRAARPGLGRRPLALWSLLLMTPAFFIEPVHLTLSFGQVNILLAAMALYDLTGEARVGRWTLPKGVLVGVVAAIKLTPLVFVPFLFVTRQTRAGCTALATFVACSVVASFTDPATSWAYWTKYATDAGRVGGVSYISNQSVRAVIDRLDHRLVSAGPVTAVSGVVLVAGVALAGWASRRRPTSSGCWCAPPPGCWSPPSPGPTTWCGWCRCWPGWCGPPTGRPAVGGGPPPPPGCSGGHRSGWCPTAPRPPSASTAGSCSGATRSSPPWWCSWSGWPPC